MYFQRIIFQNLIKQGPWSNPNLLFFFFWQRMSCGWRWRDFDMKRSEIPKPSVLATDSLLKFGCAKCQLPPQTKWLCFQCDLIWWVCTWVSQRRRHVGHCLTVSLHLQQQQPQSFLCRATLMFMSGLQPFRSCQKLQNMFFPFRTWELGRQRLHSQTAGYYPGRPERVIIEVEDEVESTSWRGGISSFIVTKMFWTQPLEFACSPHACESSPRVLPGFSSLPQQSRDMHVSLTQCFSKCRVHHIGHVWWYISNSAPQSWRVHTGSSVSTEFIASLVYFWNA